METLAILYIGFIAFAAYKGGNFLPKVSISLFAVLIIYETGSLIARALH